MGWTWDWEFIGGSQDGVQEVTRVPYLGVLMYRGCLKPQTWVRLPGKRVSREKKQQGSDGELALTLTRAALVDSLGRTQLE